MTSLPVELDIIFSWHMICSMLLTTLMAHHCILPSLKASNLWWGGQNDAVFPKQTQVPDTEDQSLPSICCLIQFSVGLTTLLTYWPLWPMPGPFPQLLPSPPSGLVPEVILSQLQESLPMLNFMVFCQLMYPTYWGTLSFCHQLLPANLLSTFGLSEGGFQTSYPEHK